MLDVWPGIFASGILLVPKDIKPGERRPVVVCQRPHTIHGEGTFAFLRPVAQHRTSQSQFFTCGQISLKGRLRPRQ